jgi:hypothetical protein
LKKVPFTSAPALKKRPSPVRTVKTVLGFSFNSLIAAIVSVISLPPKALRDFGLLNYAKDFISALTWDMSHPRLTLIMPIWPVTVTTMSLYLEDIVFV